MAPLQSHLLVVGRAVQNTPPPPPQHELSGKPPHGVIYVEVSPSQEGRNKGGREQLGGGHDSYCPCNQRKALTVVNGGEARTNNVAANVHLK